MLRSDEYGHTAIAKTAGVKKDTLVAFSKNWRCPEQRFRSTAESTRTQSFCGAGHYRFKFPQKKTYQVLLQYTPCFMAQLLRCLLTLKTIHIFCSVFSLIKYISVCGNGHDLPRNKFSAMLQSRFRRIFQSAAARNFHTHDRHALDVVIANDFRQLL